MKVIRVLSILSILGLIAGCSDPVTHIRVTMPARHETNPIEPINVPFSVGQTWDHLLSNVMESQFKIKSIDSASHILSITKSGRSETYVDCGTKKIETEGNIQEVVNAASSYQYSAWRYNHIDTHVITNKFNGKAIIFVGGNEWGSTVQVKTELELISSQQMTTTQGAVHGGSKRYSLKLNGKERKIFEGFGTTCESTGRFEKEIQELVDLTRVKNIHPIPRRTEPSFE